VIIAGLPANIHDAAPALRDGGTDFLVAQSGIYLRGEPAGRRLPDRLRTVGSDLRHIRGEADMQRSAERNPPDRPCLLPSGR